MKSDAARCATRDVLFGRYLPLISKAAEHATPVEVLGLNYAYSMDTFVQWQFGRSLGSNLIEDMQEREMYLKGFFGPSNFTFWQYEFPQFANFLRNLGLYLIPKWVDTAFQAIEDWNLQKCDQAQQILASQVELPEDERPVVFQQALMAMSEVASKPREYPSRMLIASDMFAHNSAAFETSGNTETYFFYEMSRNPLWQDRLREELLTLQPPVTWQKGKKVEIEDLPASAAIEALPILHAVITETLRLYPSVPGGQPRYVPSPCTLGGFPNIPKGTIVQAYAATLHRTPEVFPEPAKWKPERWLDASPEELSTMRHWFWAFGSGGRMCIGSNFAYYCKSLGLPSSRTDHKLISAFLPAMKYLATAVYSNFRTSVPSPGDMTLIDAYLAGPKAHKLDVLFERTGAQR